MFQIAVSENFTTVVTVKILDVSGQHRQHKFKATFLRPNQEQLDLIHDAIRRDQVRADKARLEGDEEGVTSEREMSDQKIIDDYMVGWGEVADAQGNPLDFNEANLASLLSINPCRQRIAQAFYDTVYNQPARKN